MDEKTLTTQAMADCMDMVRQELIEAGIIGADVAPMFVANAVVHHFKIEQTKAQHWKSNHDDLVKRCALLREREDLPVDRIPAYAELTRLQEESKRFAACRHQARYMQEDGGEAAFVKAIDEYRKKNGI